jgi:DNA-directed RNA polymerase subunit M/transcription elongation factor TFIIS
MKVQCPSCREIVEMTVFSTTEAGLSFTCTNCGESNFLENPHSERIGEQRQAPADTRGQDRDDTSSDRGKGGIVCPKCGNSQTDPEACHLCGLMFSRFDPSSFPPDPPEAAVLWKKILANPHDEDLHESFMRKCLNINRLDYASRQYRLLSHEPSKKQIAEKMLSRLVSKGQAQLAPGSLSSVSREDPKRKGKILFWILMVVSAALFSYFVFYAAQVINKMGS